MAAAEQKISDALQAEVEKVEKECIRPIQVSCTEPGVADSMRTLLHALTLPATRAHWLIPWHLLVDTKGGDLITSSWCL